MRRSIIVSAILLFTLTGCAGPEYVIAPAPAPMPPDPAVDYEARGDSLVSGLEERADSLALRAGSGTDAQVVSGAVSAFVGTVGATWISAASSSDTRAAVGISTSVIAASIGLYQVVAGLRTQTVEFVRAANAAITDWELAISEAGGDQEKEWRAYQDLLAARGELRRQFGRYMAGL